MSTLAITNGDSATDDVLTETYWDDAMSSIESWANGNIGADNFATFTAVVTSSITSNALAYNVTNTGTEGSMTIAHNGVLAANKSAIKVTSTGAQTTGDAMVDVDMTSASSTIPGIRIKHAGTSGSAFKISS